MRTEPPDRDGYMSRCRAHALGFLEAGQPTNAVAALSAATRLDGGEGISPRVMEGLVMAASRDIDGVRQWIEGFR